MSNTSRRKRHSDDEDEDDRKPPAKKTFKVQKREVNKIDIFAIDLVSTQIFGYLDTKELYTISKTSNYLRNLIRHKHVVRSALFHGGYAKTSMERIVALLKPNKIWVPSPLRLLRIFNGKRCERCNKNKVNLVSKDFGVFLCWEPCLTSVYSKKVGNNKKWEPFLYHPRVAAAVYSSSGYVFQKGFQDCSGNDEGPLIHLGHMNCLLQQSRVKSPANERLDELLVKIDVQAQNEDAVKQEKEILEAYDAAIKDAVDWGLKKRQKREAGTKNAIARKRIAIKAMLERLKEQMGQDGPEWKRIALEYDEMKDVQVQRSSDDLIRMKVLFVMEILEPYMRSPSKMNKKKAAELIKEIEENFKLIWERGIHDLSFIPDSEQDLKVDLLRMSAMWENQYFYRMGKRDLDQLRKLQVGCDPFEVIEKVDCFSFVYGLVKKWKHYESQSTGGSVNFECNDDGESSSIQE